VSQPHAWLGREFQDLLPELRSQEKAIRIAVTRPSGRSYGEGALRVLRVKGDADHFHLLLAYERYQPPYFQKSQRGRRGRR
jgi:hypothetical protein